MEEHPRNADTIFGCHKIHPDIPPSFGERSCRSRLNSIKKFFVSEPMYLLAGVERDRFLAPDQNDAPTYVNTPTAEQHGQEPNQSCSMRIPEPHLASLFGNVVDQKQ